MPLERSPNLLKTKEEFLEIRGRITPIQTIALLKEVGYKRSPRELKRLVTSDFSIKTLKLVGKTRRE